jgi:hypothetical protein
VLLRLGSGLPRASPLPRPVSVPWLCQVRDRAAEKELAELRRANKQERQQRQQGLNEAWGDDE